MTFLLDVNILVAMADPHHVHHEAAHSWFAAVGKPDWATCSITELGFIRLLSHPGYRATHLTPAEAADRLTRFCSSGGHSYWADDISPRVSLGESAVRIQGPGQVTDLHLVALAARRHGQLATFDGRLARVLEGTHLESVVAWVR